MPCSAEAVGQFYIYMAAVGGCAHRRIAAGSPPGGCDRPTTGRAWGSGRDTGRRRKQAWRENAAKWESNLFPTPDYPAPA
ncbi:hypothetical protein [Kamptonema formosum]|uniref:hypothetical protein n=1 Tax=Kamptonema formosum TaxID=331992 RepID=UPI0012DCA6D4|nr:hypothetical protein [Oscillatoria sp. PCC 10802]